ncbi:unnamed protein product [Arctia plantaginis]|uniref:Peptidase M14 domain-containing protein n=1 Tax=Arctia plantaginis TaxID=874455 RepID=A0A8S0ZA71_ARCPL|nr:unnamed protein product [Arctia plantaginis]
MKTYVFLIILDFIQLVVSCNHDLNLTNELYPSCPIQYFRRKRALNEYTRWQGNQETTDEFLVKVLDEELSTSNTKPIVAVNIMPMTKSGDKIIIGGAHLPSLTTLMSTTGEPREYTRFVPPTTISGREKDIMFIVSNTHATTGKTFPPSLQPQGYYTQRDDSPPASPQFIARTPLLVARQYAPIEPVAFSRRSSFAPLTPRSTTLPSLRTFNPPTRTLPRSAATLPVRTQKDFRNFQPFDEETTETFNPLTRTVPSSPATLPVRTQKDFRNFQPFDEETTEVFLTRTTYTTPKRTTKFEVSSKTDPSPYIIPTTNKLIEEGRRRQEELKKISEKELSYNMMFYNDDDSISGKKEDQEGIDNEYDKKALKEDSVPENSFTDTNEINEESETSSESIKDVETDRNDFVIFNITTIKPALEEKLRDKRRPTCSMIKLRQLNFNSPRTLPEIINQLKMWADDSPVVKSIDITRGNLTVMENPIYMMIVDDPSSGQIVTAKQTVMIVAGIQGRDHHAVAAAMYVLYQLIERTEAHTDLLTKYRFWIIPVFNPDGYDYSMTFPRRREWTKNLRQQWDPCKGRESCESCESQGIRCTLQPCYGVNLDRNFEYQWISAEELKAEHPCGGLYAGPRQLSEVETRALTQYLHETGSQLFTFIAFKEGDVLGIMYPYSHTKKKRAFDQVYRARASRAASAAYSISNRPYVAGQTSEFLPLYAGGIEDWVDGHLGIDSTYTIMMYRPSDAYRSKLITERVVHETYAAMDTLLLQSVEPLGPMPSVTLASGNHCERTLPKRSLCVIAINFLLLLNG